MKTLRVFATLLFLVAAGKLSAATVYVPPSGPAKVCVWRYAKGVDRPPADWTSPDFDDSRWASGRAPFGYGLRGKLRCGTDLGSMQGNSSTACFRRRFFVDDCAQSASLKLSVNCDDGFIAWINGVKVAEKNAPVNPAWDSVAPAAHEANVSSLGEVFPVAGSSLRNGYNVLAIQLFNHGKDDPTLHFDAALIDTRNLTFMRSTEASTVEGGAGPCLAVDGTQLSFWNTQLVPAADSPQWITVDLGRTYEIDKTRFHWWGGEHTSPSAVVYTEYELQVSSDQKNWTKVASFTEHTGGEDEATFAPVSCRYVRAYFVRSNKEGRHGLLDWEVYETGVPFDRREFDCLSFNMAATASSAQGKGMSAAKAVDSNPCSWWLSRKGIPDPQWLQVDLQSSRRIVGVKVMLTDAPVGQFAIELSADGVAWHEPKSTRDTDELRGADTKLVHRLMFSQIEEARYVRLRLLGKEPKIDQYGVTELMVLGEPTAR